MKLLYCFEFYITYFYIVFKHFISYFIQITEKQLFCYEQVAKRMFLSAELYLALERYTRRTEISAGETPEIRDAWPMEIGLYNSSFWRASIRRLPTFS